MIDRRFFQRDPLTCAQELIGCELVWDSCAGIIVETEAYAAIGDEAAHTFVRPSARAFVAEHAAGAAYVYFNYGMYWLFNVLVKAEMSHRIWEGVRHGKYKFSDLPPVVREKEATRVYGALLKQSDQTADVAKIPENDRQDFIRAYEARGKRDEAEKILERESFKNNLFRGTESKAVKGVQVQAGRGAEGKTIAAQIADSHVSGLAQPVQSAGKAKDGLTDLNLDGLKLADASSPPSSTSIPRGAPLPVKSGRSFGGS